MRNAARLVLSTGAIALLSALLLWPVSLWAHGAGRPHLTDLVIGTYQMTVWLSPDPPRTGDLRFAILLDTKNNPTPIAKTQLNSSLTEPEMQISMKSLDHGIALASQPATRQASLFQTYYESYFTLPVFGKWQVTVSITSERGTETASFVLDVLPPQPINWLLVVVIFLLSAGLIGGVGWWNRLQR